MYEQESPDTNDLPDWIRALSPDEVRARIDQYAVERGTMSQDEYDSRQSGKVRDWREQDHVEADADMLRQRALEPRALSDLHPIAARQLIEHDQLSMTALARKAASRQLGHSVSAQLGIGSIYAQSGGHALVHLETAMSSLAQGLVLERMPNVLAPILATTTPRLCRDFRAHPSAISDIEIDSPNLFEFQPFQQVIGKFSGQTLSLGSTSARLRFSPQLIESDDVSAVTSVVTAATVSMMQNELIEFAALLTTNAALTDGRDWFNATDANLISGGGKDLATVAAGIAALSAIELNGKPGNAQPRSLIVPSGDVLTAKALVDFADGPAMQVFGLPESWIGSDSWFLFPDAVSYPSILRGSLRPDGLTVEWSPGEQTQSEPAGSLILESLHAVGYAPISRSVVQLEVA